MRNRRHLAAAALEQLSGITDIGECHRLPAAVGVPLTAFCLSPHRCLLC
jgi:hypothetical protein